MVKSTVYRSRGLLMVADMVHGVCPKVVSKSMNQHYKLHVFNQILTILEQLILEIIAEPSGPLLCM